LEKKVGAVMDREQFRAEYEHIGFLGELVTVRRKSDGVTGVMNFQNIPVQPGKRGTCTSARFYWNFRPARFGFDC